jgi:hypothetical protein
MLQTSWDLKNNKEEFLKRLPGGQLLEINAPCCNQFLLSRDTVHRRPLHVWMDLLNMIGVRDVCHEGELDYENLWSYHRWGMVSGPEPATYFVTTPIGNALPQEGEQCNGKLIISYDLSCSSESCACLLHYATQNSLQRRVYSSYYLVR